MDLTNKNASDICEIMPVNYDLLLGGMETNFSKWIPVLVTGCDK